VRSSSTGARSPPWSEWTCARLPSEPTPSCRLARLVSLWNEWSGPPSDAPGVAN
jgi:hypothetical protein